MRLFVALELPKSIRDLFKDMQDKIKNADIIATFPKFYHITLLFLGEVAEDNLDKIKQSLREIRFNSFELSLSKIGVFPNENHIRVVWIGIKEQKPVESLAKDVERVLEMKQDRKFHSHITLARVKSIGDGDKFKEILKGIKVIPETFKVDSFKLIKSTLQKTGPIYETIEEFRA